MVITKEETFGPIAPLCRFNTDAEDIDMANDTPTLTLPRSRGREGGRRLFLQLRHRPYLARRPIRVWRLRARGKVKYHVHSVMPNGAISVEMMPSLMPTMPYSRARRDQTILMLRSRTAWCYIRPPSAPAAPRNGWCPPHPVRSFQRQ